MGGLAGMGSADNYLFSSLSFLDAPISAPASLRLTHDDFTFVSPSQFAASLTAPPPFDIFHSAVSDLDLLVPAPTLCSLSRRLVERCLHLGPAPDSAVLRGLSSRVEALERRFDRLLGAAAERDQKYTWTAKIKSPAKDGLERKYKLREEVKGGSEQRNHRWAAQINGGKSRPAQKKVLEVKEVDGVLKNYKLTVETRDEHDDGEDRSYSFKASSIFADEHGGSGKKKEGKEKKGGGEKNGKKVECGPRVVEIEDTTGHGAVVLRQAFARRPMADGKCKGKKKVLSPQDAAFMIQMTFRAYLLRRSQSLRALRDLAIAKTKLKEIRALFHNFSYRNHTARDAEERQKFSERIIVLLLTVDAIEGVDIMVRSSKRSMVDELETMLDMVDPPNMNKSLSVRRRTFDMPSGAVQRDVAEGVAKLVEIVEGGDHASSAFSLCV